jgi:hypothetical protein
MAGVLVFIPALMTDIGAGFNGLSFSIGSSDWVFASRAAPRSSAVVD